MKISLNWIKEYISFSQSPQMIAEKLTLSGQEVEKIVEHDKDHVLELEITPNRPDCLCHLGLARELSAILEKPLKTPMIKEIPSLKKTIALSVLDKKLCPFYSGILIRNVKVQESPLWLKQYLNAIGLRSINNIVDITNFCLMESGQPLHAFDFDKIEGSSIVVRLAKPNEVIKTLDQENRTLDSSVLVIADQVKPIALAGIMGGELTQVTTQTKNILIESAYFDPISIRRTARRLGLSSDSSYRFERGVDRAGVLQAAYRATHLILQLAKGKVDAKKVFQIQTKKEKKLPIILTVSAVNDRLGTTLESKKITRILKSLGCHIQQGSSDKKKKVFLKVIGPSFRADLKTDVDLIEEISRIYGYNQIPSSVFAIAATATDRNEARKFKNDMKAHLVALGFSEVITYTMTDRRTLKKFKLETIPGEVRVKNALSSEQELMRPHIWPGLLKVLATNVNRGQRNLRIFEIGQEYSFKEEKSVLALAMTGEEMHDWREGKRVWDYYDLKGVIERLKFLLSEKTHFEFKLNPHPVLKDPTATAILINDQPIGLIGQVSSEVLNEFDIKFKNVYLARLDLEMLLAQSKFKEQFLPWSEYPPILRDISLAIKNERSFDQVQQIVRRFGGDFLKEIQLIEVYVGDKIPSGYRGIVFSLTFQSFDRTLKEEEINQVYNDISQNLIDQLQAIKR